ncbi:MAG: tyrosine--tRNA ligase [Planctomycetes bacterium]|nr:tyrosine--tRNA ligase [Planctomycetota bacterium]
MPSRSRTEKTRSAADQPRAPIDFLDELKWRGLLHQCTDEDGLREHLSTGARCAYVGFDPTADSLTIGNLVPIMLLVHFQRAGHTPIVVMGGGTGLIGDPSGKSAERQLMTAEEVEANVTSQKRVFESIWTSAATLSGDRKAWTAPQLTNNADWLTKLSYIDVLRDVGKHFSVNMMIQKHSVRERLNNREQGITYTEFSYMILQAYDFLALFYGKDRLGANLDASAPVPQPEKDRITIQMGGSDQWGNIVAGSDLIRRTCGEDYRQGENGAPWCFGLTAPLVTKADGGKFGKTESGAIWLTADRTSPYTFFQFWLNTDDGDLEKFLKLFTLLPEARVDELMQLHETNPGRREAHRELANHMTTLLHGPAAAAHADAASKALFSGDVADLPLATLTDVFASVPSSEHDKADLDGEGLSLVDFLTRTTLAKSKRESREFLSNGSVSVNGRKVGMDHRLTKRDLLHGRLIAIRRGKKSWHVTRWGK